MRTGARLALVLVVLVGLMIGRLPAGPFTGLGWGALFAGKTGLTPVQARLIEIKIQLAWLADSLTFACPLQLHWEDSSLRIQGRAPSLASKERALELAQQQTTVALLDDIRIVPWPTRPHPVNTASLTAAAQHAVEEHVASASDLVVWAEASGRVVVRGSVGSLEEQLAASLALRSLPGCRCVYNCLVVRPVVQNGEVSTRVSSNGTQVVRGEQGFDASRDAEAGAAGRLVWQEGFPPYRGPMAPASAPAKPRHPSAPGHVPARFAGSRFPAREIAATPRADVPVATSAEPAGAEPGTSSAGRADETKMLREVAHTEYVTPAPQQPGQLPRWNLGPRPRELPHLGPAIAVSAPSPRPTQVLPPAQGPAVTASSPQPAGRLAPVPARQEVMSVQHPPRVWPPAHDVRPAPAENENRPVARQDEGPAGLGTMPRPVRTEGGEEAAEAGSAPVRAALSRPDVVRLKRSIDRVCGAEAKHVWIRPQPGGHLVIEIHASRAMEHALLQKILPLREMDSGLVQVHSVIEP